MVFGISFSLSGVTAYPDFSTIVVSHLSDRESDNKRANEQLQNLIANREVFIKSTRLTLEENYPHFFAYLHDKGLEEFEIDFCCLYAIGMKGKEVKAYTNLGIVI